MSSLGPSHTVHVEARQWLGRLAPPQPRDVEEQMTFGERVADGVAGFGGSWTFIITSCPPGDLAGINVVLRGAPGIPIRSSCST